MKQLFNHLVQLQELNFALAEQTAANPKAAVDQLRQAIEKLAAQLPPEVASRYQALQGRFPLAVVPMVHSTCSGCLRSLPSGLANEIKAAERLFACPQCGRFLYHPDHAVRAPIPTTKDKDRKPPSTGLSRFSSVELMVPRLKATTRDEAIAELAQTMAANRFVDDAALVTRLALDREAMISTAVDHGLAFPHVRNVETGSLTLALGLKPGGLRFGEPDGHLTKIVFLIVIPAAASAFYLKLIAGLVRSFGEAKDRERLLDADTAETLWKTLLAQTRAAIP